MTRPRRTRRWILAITTLGVALPLALLLLYSSSLRRVILEPMTWIIDDMSQALASLPQMAQWGIGLLVGVVILGVAWEKIPDDLGVRARPGRRRVSLRPFGEHPLERLASDLTHARRRHVSRVRILRELSILAVRLIAQREAVSIDEARKLLVSGEWPEDPDIRRFFASRQAGRRTIPRAQFREAVARTVSYLEHYHQEV